MIDTDTLNAFREIAHPPPREVSAREGSPERPYRVIIASGATEPLRLSPQEQADHDEVTRRLERRVVVIGVDLGPLQTSLVGFEGLIRRLVREPL